ncbi:MAG: GntR family transcriptional regulator [Planctomycetota bacterium]|nr:GntR family transcriptional regulator [Planctomycetota bacterium]
MKKHPDLRAPKHVRIRELLRERIAEGTYPPGSRLPTESELPKQLRVSSTTVIRALNDLAREGLIVRRRRSGSYVADPNRKPLIPGRHLRVGVLANHSVMPDWRFTSSFHRSLLAGLMERWHVRVPGRSAPAGDADPTRMTWQEPARGITLDFIGEEMAARRMHPSMAVVREGRYDALVTLGIVEDGFLAGLSELGTPLVLVDNPGDRFSDVADQVYFDPLPGFRKAIAHLAARGARRFHFVGGLLRKPDESFASFLASPDRFKPERGRFDPDGLLRLSAYRQVLFEQGLPVSEKGVHFTWVDKRHFADLAKELAARPEPERPDAVVCHSVMQAQGMIEIFAERGLPLLGAGVTDEGYLGPALPVHASGRAMGHTAASLLLWKLQQPDRPPLRVGVPTSAPAAQADSLGQGVRP